MPLRSLLLLTSLTSCIAVCQPQRHDRIYVLPCQGPVTVDGDLREWDLSGALEASFDEALRPRFVFRAALMHDAAALYLGCHFSDDTPLTNRHDPAVEPTRGWDADCLQVRLCSDPAAPYPLPASNDERICHLTCWYFTDGRQPVLQAQYGMDYHGMRVLTGDDSGVAFRADADGKGYTLEARVPWTLLNAPTPPRAGDRLALVLQPLWGDSTGQKQILTYNEVQREAGFSFQGTSMWGQAILLERGNLGPGDRALSVVEQVEPLELPLPAADPKAVSLSAALFGAQGVLVRTLPVTTGSQDGLGEKVALRWDGLDDDGKPLPPGEYTVRTLSHRGIGQRWVASLHNAGNPPWRTDDGTGSWGGDHGPPIAAACDDTRVYLGWTVSEAGWSMIAVDKALTRDGRPRKLWGQHQVLEIGICVTALVSDGERLFVAQDGKGWGAGDKPGNTAGVVIWDAATGTPVNFPFGKRTLVASEWPDSLQPKPKPFWEKVAQHDLGPTEAGLNLLGLAVMGDELYVALNLENKVVAFNWRTGERLREYAVPSPVGLATDREGRGLLVVSGRAVSRLNLDSGALTPVVEGLDHPWGLAVDKQERIYVSDCGAAMQVKVFAADGTALGAIGRAGGRPWIGRYDPGGMLLPAGLTVDAEGKVWVAEYDSTPKRVSVWSAEGKLLADLLGGGAYAVEGIADDREPEWINCQNTLFRVDLDSGQTETVATLVRPCLTGPQFTAAGGFMGRAMKTRHVGGYDYLVWPGFHYVIIYRLGADLAAQPVAATGWLKDWLVTTGLGKDSLPADVRDAAFADAFRYGFTWTDQSGDGNVQPEEVVAEKVDNAWGFYWGSWVDEDLSIWTGGRLKEGEVFRLPVSSWLPGGVPAYPRPSEWRSLFRIGQEGRYPQLHDVMPGRDGVYVMEQLEGSTQTGQGAKFQALSRYTLDGKRLWAYRKVWLGFGLDAPLAKPGDVIGAMKFVGKATLPQGLEVVAVNGYFGQFNLLADSGLWVTSLCKDNRYGPKADATTVWPENFSGWFFRHPRTGKFYLMAGDTDLRIWEITGLDTVRTAEARLTMTEADREKAALAAARRQGLSTDRPAIVLAKTKAPVTIDGDLRDWDLGHSVTVDAGGGRSARVTLARDDQRLLGAFQVTDDSPLRNAGDDFALLFKTGDACEVFLATDPAAPVGRKRPAPGDVRLLFSVMGGDPVCVLYQPVLAAGERAPRMFSSPVSAEPFDRVVLVKDAQVAVTRSADGYVLEAAVPLATLGFSPSTGMTTRGDVGVIFSDPGGSRNVLRVDYSNKETAIVNDIPSEARLEPAKWGEVRVE